MEKLLALGAILWAASRKNEAPKETTAPPEQRPIPTADEKKTETPNLDFGKLGETAGIVGGLIGKLGGGKVAVDVVGWGIPTAIAGVSTGFLVVAGLWGLALVSGIVFSALLAPEMARRGTMGRAYSAERGSFLWRAARLYWANLVVAKRGNSERVAMLRWPDLETAWGQLSVLGFLPVVVRPGENTPSNSETVSPDDQYEVYAWPNTRSAPSIALANDIADAHKLAQLWVYGFASFVRACGVVIGEVKNGAPIADSLYTTEGVGLICNQGLEVANAPGRVPRLEEQRAAWLQGVKDGMDFVKRASWGFAGQRLLDSNDAQAVASILVQWQPQFVAPKGQEGSQALFTSSGRLLEIANVEGDKVSLMIEVR